jgi:hypothetical protein
MLLRHDRVIDTEGQMHRRVELIQIVACFLIPAMARRLTTPVTRSTPITSRKPTWPALFVRCPSRGRQVEIAT